MTSVHRGGLWKRFAILGLSIGSMATYVDCPSNQQPTLTCTDFTVFLNPDSCQVFANPCGDGRWLDPPRSDGFRLEDRPDAIYVKTERPNGVTTRSICTAPGAGILDRPIAFVYGIAGSPAFGTGHMTVKVAPLFTVVATATPTTIGLDQESQLVAQAFGGNPPYSYVWFPSGALSSENIPLPIASPTRTTDYMVRVTDESGRTREATVTVYVNFGVLVNADPQAILPDDVSQLNATVFGGRWPYSFSWSPTGPLSDPILSDPLLGNPGAGPFVTTTYTVTVTDADGATVTGSVEVTVLLLVTPTASPGAIDVGQSTQLDASSQGGDGQYTYSWSPTTGLSDPTVRMPVASPIATTTYTVTVTDGHGLTATGDVTVTVNAADPPPTAAFTFTRVPCSATVPCSDGATIGQEVFLNGSSSAGNIPSYLWEFDWTPTSPDAVSSGPLANVVLPEGNQRGNIVLTVTAADGQMAMLSRRFP